MKKKFLLLACCLIFTVSGCNRKAPEVTSSSSAVSQPKGLLPSSSESVSSEPPSSSSVSISSAISIPDTSPVILNDEFGIPDPVLYQAILSELKKQPNEHFTVNEALSISFLNYGFKKDKIKELRGIGILKNLTFLHLAENEITDATPVTSLKRLKSLNLASNKLTDTSIFSGMTQLDSLTLAYNQITDISPLSKLANLRELGLWYNQITDITPLLSLNKLSLLSLEANRLDMSDPAIVDAVGTMRGRIKYFALGLQGFQSGKTYSSVNLYIDRQQTLDSFSNIYYTKATLDGNPIDLNTFYKVTEPGKHTLHLYDNQEPSTKYPFNFTIN